MNYKALFLFVILLLGLILCTFLGSNNKQGFTTNSYSNDNGAQAATLTTNQGNTYGVAQGSQGNVATASNSNYDNYNHFAGTSMPSIFYGPDGGTARVIQTSNNNTIVITNKNGTTDIYYIDNSADTTTMNTYYGPNGGSARIITQSDGKQAVEITTSSGSKILYTEDNIYIYNQDSDSSSNSTNSTNYDMNQYYGPNGGQATTVSGPQGNTAGVATTPNGNMYAGTNYDSTAYYNSLPQGIPQNQIPDGQQDLYILKSEVVPPVCPACPEPIVQCPNNYDPNKVPPCPPCARCPEPAFDCKKVPNYNAFNPDYMPVPMLNDFSSFGM